MHEYNSQYGIRLSFFQLPEQVQHFLFIHRFAHLPVGGHAAIYFHHFEIERSSFPYFQGEYIVSGLIADGEGIFQTFVSQKYQSCPASGQECIGGNCGAYPDFVRSPVGSRSGASQDGFDAGSGGIGETVWILGKQFVHINMLIRPDTDDVREGAAPVYEKTKTGFRKAFGSRL